MTTETSPMPERPMAVMSFADAMKRIVLGDKIHKLEWEDKEFYGFLNNGFLSLHTPDGKSHQWIVSEGDLIGTDYFVI